MNPPPDITSHGLLAAGTGPMVPERRAVSTPAQLSTRHKTIDTHLGVPAGQRPAVATPTDIRSTA
ncbi:hypothetical protein ACFY1U_20005 [Streptomyces sp. NPDC001351]|uniref:hypothetical protein n=1 Tax=Streptomyces sp. NPDC001351 TaxID=3364564 RepID=UPI00368C9DBF